MQTIDFYKLARPVQERFVGSVNGTGLPAPILRTAAQPRGVIAWLAASALSIVAVAVLFRLGYGDLASKSAIHGAPYLAIDVGLVALAVLGVLRVMALRREFRKSPFRRGVYVFPVGLIDATRPSLRVYPIEDLGNVDGPDAKNQMSLAFSGRVFRFTVKDGAQAEHARAELSAARGKVEEVAQERESLRPKALAALDPLQGYANPLVSSMPLAPSAPAWAKFGWAFALVTGGVIGTSVWAVHNVKSDDAMYAHAVAANDVTSLRAYLAKGSRHKEKIAVELLPRAELHAAESAKSVEAIEQYIKDHPMTAIGGEVTASRRAAMMGELESAKQAGTLAALDDFARKHPQHHLDAEVKAARHAVYAAALERYKALAPAKGANEVAFVERLLAFAEKKGPPIEVRFHRLQSKTLDKADAAVEKHRFFKGTVSLPSRYFDATHAKPREDALAAAVVERFGQAFPTEILAMAVGEPVGDPEAPLPPQVLVPTLFIEHGPSFNGVAVATKNPPGVFVGLELSFAASFRIPEDPKPLKIKLDVWKAPATKEAKGEDKPEETVYDKMNDEGFDAFQRKLLGAFFKTK